MIDNQTQYPKPLQEKRQAIAQDWIATHGLIANAVRTASQESDLTGSRPPCIRLNLESLRPFETIDSQFRPWGITLSNAIALDPSNNAFPPRSGRIVLMGAPKNGWLEIIFHRPARFCNLYITSSQRAILCAYGREGQVLDQDELRQSNLAQENASTTPNACLQVYGPEITRVTLYAFDGQMTIDDPSYGF
ncbi:MAG: hypothetical protein SAJ12_20235 [Jaaginema sp. PMC 1079.18]|nr:hypothetical protein [Jaaginema sp. PMC 1080.18]MEC4853317.1 hypothetical protein [Jaaginema sp. PMC 1079.18]MEC4865827.1 hypothetical protein [Jaaginema sp. PMC 1078.18]